MLDYRQQRDEFNRSASTDRRSGERRCAERRGEDRRQRERRGASGHDGTVVVEHERRRADRRELARRESERRALNRRQVERRRDPSRIRRFPSADGFLTAEEREFLMEMIRLTRDEEPCRDEQSSRDKQP